MRARRGRRGRSRQAYRLLAAIDDGADAQHVADRHYWAVRHALDRLETQMAPGARTAADALRLAKALVQWVAH